MMFSQRSRCAFPLVLHTATPVHQFQVVVCSQRNERVPAFLDRPSDCVDRSWPRIALHPKPLTIAEQRTVLICQRRDLSWLSQMSCGKPFLGRPISAISALPRFPYPSESADNILQSLILCRTNNASASRPINLKEGKSVSHRSRQIFSKLNYHCPPMLCQKMSNKYSQ